MKRIAYECPITHIADTFYRLLNNYVVSKFSSTTTCQFSHVQYDDLSTTNLFEDPISIFFDLTECPTVVNIPIELNPITGEIIRKSTDLNLEIVFDEYDQSNVPLKSLLD